MLSNLLSLTLLVGLTATTLLLCFDKWGWLQAWEVKGPAWLPKRCELCAGFWLAVGGCGLAVVGLGLPWWFVGTALPAAAVCRVGYGLSTGR